MNTILVILGLGFGLLFVYVAAMLARVERGLEREAEARRELRGEFSEHKWDVLAALRVLGLKRTLKRDSEWVKE